MAAKIIQSALCYTNKFPRPKPSVFYFPGLNTKPFFNPDEFLLTELLKNNFDTIKTEYLKLIEIQPESDYNLNSDEHKLHNGQWDWNSFILKGKIQNRFKLTCPNTASILDTKPEQSSSRKNLRLMKSTPFAFSFFSTLQPYTSISPHYGPCNLRIRCHFPLVIPNGDCGISVAGIEKKWEVGEPLFFDDCFQHFVWNNTNEKRVVLLFDLWHPELSDDEIAAIEEMFEGAKRNGWLKS